MQYSTRRTTRKLNIKASREATFHSIWHTANYKQSDRIRYGNEEKKEFSKISGCRCVLATEGLVHELVWTGLPAVCECWEEGPKEHMEKEGLAISRTRFILRREQLIWNGTGKTSLGQRNEIVLFLVVSSGSPPIGVNTSKPAGRIGLLNKESK